MSVAIKNKRICIKGEKEERGESQKTCCNKNLWHVLLALILLYCYKAFVV